jgi:uncharacterized protein
MMGPMERAVDRNVLGDELVPCSLDPLTGFYRDGCCSTGEEDLGTHVVCSEVTADFLEFSKMAGNDLSTPRPEYRFPGLVPGDRWCLCASRWAQALAAGMAPRVYLASTHEHALRYATIGDLMRHAVDHPG